MNNRDVYLAAIRELSNPAIKDDPESMARHYIITKAIDCITHMALGIDTIDWMERRFRPGVHSDMPLNVAKAHIDTTIEIITLMKKKRFEACIRKAAEPPIPDDKLLERASAYAQSSTSKVTADLVRDLISELQRTYHWIAGNRSEGDDDDPIPAIDTDHFISRFGSHPELISLCQAYQRMRNERFNARRVLGYAQRRVNDACQIMS